MDQQELNEYLSNNLSIETTKEIDFGSEYVVIKLTLEGVEISSDTIYL